MRKVFRWTLFFIIMAPNLWGKNTNDKERNENFLRSYLCNYSKEKGIVTISRNRLCTLETRTLDTYCYVHVFSPDKSECKKIQCSQDLSRLHPIQGMAYNWMTKTKHRTMDTKKRLYPLLIEEYMQGIPMWWKLQTMQELKNLVTYFANQTTIQNIPPIENNMLFISVEDHSLTTPNIDNSAALTNQEINFLETYFHIVDDEKIIENYHALHQKMMIQLSKIESLDFLLVSDSLTENITHNFRRHIKFLGTIRDLAITMLTFYVYGILKKLEPVIEQNFLRDQT